jgi:hypothetical protein
MSWILGDPERRRKRQKQQEDLDHNYYKRQKAYNDAKEKERERIATIKGTQDAQKIANQKPFYQKLMGAAATIGKDLVKNSSNMNTNALFSWDDPAPKRKRRKKRRSR